MPVRRGRELLQLPGPTNVPELRAMNWPLVDFASPEFTAMIRGCLQDAPPRVPDVGRGVRYVALGTRHGRRHSPIWSDRARRSWSLTPACPPAAGAMRRRVWRRGPGLAADWRCPLDSALIEEALRGLGYYSIKAVLQVHIETSTGLAPRRGSRAPCDRLGRPSGPPGRRCDRLPGGDGPADGCHWRPTSCSPPRRKADAAAGLGFVAVGERRGMAQGGGLPRRYWDWGSRRRAISPYVVLRHAAGLDAVRPCESSPCCSRRGCRRSSPGTGGWRRRHAGPSGAGPKPVRSTSTCRSQRHAPMRSRPWPRQRP